MNTIQTETGDRRAGLFRHAPLALAGALVLWVAFRIQTYVCSQDPANYVHLALRLVQAPWGSEDLLQVLYTMSPWYPLALAASIRLFGTLAPYWVNLFFIWGFLAGWWWLLGQVLSSGRERALALWAALFYLVAGYAANVQFLIYPFREAMSFCFIFLGYGLAVRADREDRPALHAASGAALLLGIGAREPSVLAAAAVLVLTLTHRGGWPRRLRHAAGFLAPFLAAACAWLIITRLSGRWMTGQLGGWLHEMRTAPGEGPLARTLANSRVMAAVVFGQIGWSGVALLVFGLYPRRHTRLVYVLLVLPALGMGLFYSSYYVYMRYVLSVLIFLAPVIGLGLANAVALGLALARRARVRAEALPWAVLCALLGGFLLFLLRLDPGDFSRADVRAFLARAREVVGRDTVYFIERRNRDMAAALSGHTAAEPGRLDELPAALNAGRRVLFVKPLNEDCFAAGKIREEGVLIEELLRDHGDLVPCPDSGPEPWTLGSGRYAPMRLVPRRLTRVRELVKTPAGEFIVLWLNFRNADPDDVKTVRLRDGGGRVVHETSLAGGGLQPIWFPGPFREGARLAVEVESPGVLPGELVAGVQSPSEPVSFSLGFGRLRAVEDWILPPFAMPVSEDSLAAVFHAEGRLKLPWPEAPAARRMDLTLVGLRRPSLAQSLPLHALQNGRPVKSLSPEAHERHWRLPLLVERDGNSRTADLDLFLQHADPDPALHFPLTDMEIRYGVGE